MNSFSQSLRHISGSRTSVRTQGILFAIFSAVTFGLIPLFSVPVLRMGMNTYSVLFYRYVIACVVMLGVLVVNQKDLKINFREILWLSVFGILYDVSAMCLYYGYQYMSSGVATTLIFMYPVWTAVIMTLFFRERLSAYTLVAILLAVGGVYFLSGDQKLETGTPWYAIGIVMISGLSYSVYMVMVDRLNIREMGSLKLTFYVFLFGLFFLTGFLYAMGNTIEPVLGTLSWINLILLGIIPTVLSNVFLIKAISKVGSTLAAILGAFEPVIAVAIGVTLLNEPFTTDSAIGIGLIIIAVTILVIKKK